MEIGAEKIKLMTNSANGIQREMKFKGQKLGTVTSFKYLGAIVSDKGSKPMVLSRIAQATAALTKRKPIWRDNISLGSKLKCSPLSYPYFCTPVSHGPWWQSYETD